MDNVLPQTTVESWEAYVSVLSPLISAITVAVIVGIFLYDRRSARSEGTYNHNLAWQGFNQVLTVNTEFIDFERKLHPFDNLSREEMLRVYYWFMRFNVVYRAHRSKKHKTMAEKLGESSWANEVNLSFGDREFIRRNVFPRGYDDELARAFEAGWRQIKEDKLTLPMADAPTESEYSRVPPIYNADFSNVGSDDTYEHLINVILDPNREAKERTVMLEKLIQHQAASSADDARNVSTEE